MQNGGHYNSPSGINKESTNETNRFFVYFFEQSFKKKIIYNKIKKNA